MWKGLLMFLLLIQSVLYYATVMLLCIWYVGISENFSRTCCIHADELASLYATVDLVLCKQACFDFARITTTVIDADIIPVENVIRSIACILCLDENKSMAFRYVVYV